MQISKIILPDGSVLSSGNGLEDGIVSVSFTEKVNDQTQLVPGSVCSTVMEVSVIAPQGKLRLEKGMEVQLFQDDSCVGLFTLEKPTRSSANMLKLTGYDRISRLDQDLSQWLAGLADWPYSLEKFAWMVCARCGLELENTQLPNGEHPVRQFTGTAITGRQLLQWVGQVCGRFCRATAEGKLRFDWYRHSPVSVGITGAEGQAQGYAATLQAPEGAVLRPVSTVSRNCKTITLQRTGRNILDLVSLLGETYTNSMNGLQVHLEEGCAVVQGTHTYASFTNILQSEDLSNHKLILLPGDYSCPKSLTLQLRTLDTGVNRNYSGSFTLEEPRLLRVFYIAYSKVGTVVNARIPLTVVADTRIPQSYLPYEGERYTVALPQEISSGSYDWFTGILTMEDGTAVQLQPRQIPALEGENVLLSDCGDTAVNYRQMGFYQDSLHYEDYQICPVEKVQLRMTDSDVGVIWPQVEGNCMSITGNPMLAAENTEQNLSVAQSLFDLMEGVTYTPCKVTIPATQDIKAGDILSITDKNGHKLTAYVMTRTRNRQRDTLECTGSYSRQNVEVVNELNLSALSGKVLELKTQVEGLQVENRDAKNNAAGLWLEVEGIRTQVKCQEQTALTQQEQLTRLEQSAKQLQISVQTMETQGAEKVTTKTGFTFDENGLTVAKDGSEIVNRIDEKGMYVRGGEKVMLQADAYGVTATDVSVRNFLVIGDRARFEDYADGTRTACFYIGG